MAVLGYIFISIALVLGVIVVAEKTGRRFTFHSPIELTRKGRVSNHQPSPDQWLLDRATEQQHNPIPFLVRQDTLMMRFTKDARRPKLSIRIYYTNLGIYDLEVGYPEGYPSYQSEQLPDFIRAIEGKTNVPAHGGRWSVDLNIFIPEEFMKPICEELESEDGIIRGIELNGVTAKVWVKGDSEIHRLSLGQPRMTVRQNR